MKDRSVYFKLIIKKNWRPYCFCNIAIFQNWQKHVTHYTRIHSLGPGSHEKQLVTVDDDRSALSNQIFCVCC